MARSFLSRSLALVAIACAAVSSAVTSTIDRAFGYARSFAVDVVSAFKVESPFHPGQAPEAKQSLGLVAAKAFKLRVDGRDRPTMTPRWRMCPSA